MEGEKRREGALQKQKGCFNQLGLSQLHLHNQAKCIQADQLTDIQVSNFRQHTS